MKLTDLFDQVYIINCQHRPDRKERVSNHLQELDLVDWDKVTWQKAIIGDYTGHPAYWKSGRGAWGCLQSHRRILEDVLHIRDEDGPVFRSVLILEDDVVFSKDSKEILDIVKGELPEKWGQLYLGGQHKRTPDEYSNHLKVARQVNRTHAYAVHRDIYKRIYQHISHAPDYIDTTKHVDHQLELAHKRRDWLTLCVHPWMAGQAAGSSNISGKIIEEKWWT